MSLIARECNTQVVVVRFSVLVLLELGLSPEVSAQLGSDQRLVAAVVEGELSTVVDLLAQGASARAQSEDGNAISPSRSISPSGSSARGTT